MSLWNENISCCISRQEMSQPSVISGLQMWKKVKVAQPCLTLCDPLGILQARILEWVAFPFSMGSSQPRDQTPVSHTAGRFFTSWATREAQVWLRASKTLKWSSGCCHHPTAPPTVMAEELGACKQRCELRNRIGPRELRCLKGMNSVSPEAYTFPYLEC